MNSTDGTIPDFLQMVINMSGSFPAIGQLIEVIFALIGLVLFILALLDMYRMGNDKARSSGPPPTGASITWRIVVSIVLTSLAVMVDITQNTLTGNAVNSAAFMYQSAGLSASQKLAVQTVLSLFSLAGYIAFGRGWLLLDKHFNGSRDVGVASPIWHIIGGTMLVFLDVWLKILSDWTGFDFMKLLLF